MSEFTQEAKALRERLSRYPQQTQEGLAQILKIEFEFVQLFDIILRTYPLDAQAHEAIAYLEESRDWAGLSLKRGEQIGYKRTDYSKASGVSSDSSEQIESVASRFEIVLNTLLERCKPNREMDFALARLEDAKKALNREAVPVLNSSAM